MSGINIFEAAVRNKFRFPYKGQVTVEDLWDLPLTELDKVFKILNKQFKQSKEESLLSTKSKEDETLELQIEIIKHIVSVKLAEKEAKEQEAKIKEKKQKIMSIIAEKQDEVLKNQSVEELEKMLEELKN